MSNANLSYDSIMGPVRVKDLGPGMVEGVEIQSHRRVKFTSRNSPLGKRGTIITVDKYNLYKRHRFTKVDCTFFERVDL